MELKKLSAVVVSVSDKYLWCLKPFAHLFNKYWGSAQDVIIAGYSPPSFALPRNFFFYSIDQPSYPKEKWADGFIKFLEYIPDQFFVLLLEDYWISRVVDVEAINLIEQYMTNHTNILRGDLTADRLYAGGMRDIDMYDRLDIIEAPNSAYQMSLQAAVWNTNLLKTLLKSLAETSRSAWSVELDGTTTINNNPSTYKVIGTRQVPIRYCNAMNNSSGFNAQFSGLSQIDIDYVKDMIPK